MNKYQNAKIYKIISDETDDIYIGSTCQKYLCQRMTTHRANYKKNIKITSSNILKYDDAQIILIETYPCDNVNELRARERYFIETLDNVINKCVPNRTRQETIKAYQKNNKDKIKKQQHLKYIKNRDKNKQ